VKSTSFFTREAPQVTEGGVSMPDVTIRRRLDGGYTVGLSGRGLLELSPQGLLYARQFWPTFKKRKSLLSISIGRSFFDGPESLQRWKLDGVSPFERVRTLDPPADDKLIQMGLKRLAANYPALANLQVAELWARAMNFQGVMRNDDRRIALDNLMTATSHETYLKALAQINKFLNREYTAIKEKQAGEPMRPLDETIFDPRRIDVKPRTGGGLPPGWSVEAH